MQLQQFDPKMISITQLRRDIDILENILAQNDEALIVRNQSLLFAALSPKNYEKYQMMTKQSDTDSISDAVASINAFREKYGKTKVKNAGSKAVIRMRDDARKRWNR
ncbi:hypothetical protein HY085_03075 [Candidatus Gottesmanbacteria bacterium]|nr:hypothetical protein [Candidatus Gottesmanbacteria bacterium]